MTAEGKLPVAAGEEGAVQLSEVDKKYNTLCASCHGDQGDGKAPAGQALNPKARDFTDGSWQSSVDDSRIAKVIKDGGPAVGLSGTMAAWAHCFPTIRFRKW